MMKISFDFDSTLGEERMQRLAAKFIKDGHDVWVTTSRLSDENAPSSHWNRDLKSVITDLGIPLSKVQFTNGKDKCEFLDGFDIHFDDDQVEIDLIEAHLENCVGVLILDL